MSQQSEPQESVMRVIGQNRVTFFDTILLPDGTWARSDGRTYNIRLVSIEPSEITEAALQDLGLAPIHPSAVWPASFYRPRLPIPRGPNSNRHIQWAGAATPVMPQTAEASEPIEGLAQRIAAQLTSTLEIRHCRLDRYIHCASATTPTTPHTTIDSTTAMSDASTIDTQEQFQQPEVHQAVSTDHYPLILDGGVNSPVSEKHLAKVVVQKVVENTMSSLAGVKRAVSQGWNSIKRRCQKAKRDFDGSLTVPSRSHQSDYCELEELRETNREQRDNMFVYTETGRPIGW